MKNSFISAAIVFVLILSVSMILTGCGTPHYDPNTFGLNVGG